MKRLQMHLNAPLTKRSPCIQQQYMLYELMIFFETFLELINVEFYQMALRAFFINSSKLAICGSELIIF